MYIALGALLYLNINDQFGRRLHSSWDLFGTCHYTTHAHISPLKPFRLWLHLPGNPQPQIPLQIRPPSTAHRIQLFQASQPTPQVLLFLLVRLPFLQLTEIKGIVEQRLVNQLGVVVVLQQLLDPLDLASQVRDTLLLREGGRDGRVPDEADEVQHEKLVVVPEGLIVGTDVDCFADFAKFWER